MSKIPQLARTEEDWDLNLGLSNSKARFSIVIFCGLLKKKTGSYGMVDPTLASHLGLYQDPTPLPQGSAGRAVLGQGLLAAESGSCVPFS